MKSFGQSGYALAVSGAAALLAGCGGPQSPIAVPSMSGPAASHSHSRTFSRSRGGERNGYAPLSGTLDRFNGAATSRVLPELNIGSRRLGSGDDS